MCLDKNSLLHRFTIYNVLHIFHFCNSNDKQIFKLTNFKLELQKIKILVLFIVINQSGLIIFVIRRDFCLTKKYLHQVPVVPAMPLLLVSSTLPSTLDYIPYNKLMLLLF